MCWILALISSLGASEGQFLLFPVLDPQPNSFPLDFGFALKCSAQKVTPYRLKQSTKGVVVTKECFNYFRLGDLFFSSIAFVFFAHPLAGSTDNDNDIDEQEEDEDKKEDQEVGKEAEGWGSQNCKTKSATHPPLIQSFDPQIITQKMMMMMIMMAMTNKSGTLNVNLAAAHIRDHSFPIWCRHLD